MSAPAIDPATLSRYVFLENNSGGYFRLSRGDYDRLMLNGWADTGEGDRYGSPGIPWSLAGFFPSHAAAIRSWERITGADYREPGCSCCGPPFTIWQEGDE